MPAKVSKNWTIAAALAGYLLRRPEQEFYLAPFIDYRGADGLYRKYRVALIAGRPYASHMAVSTHWMIHYLNADMMGQAEPARRRGAVHGDIRE